MEKKTLMEKLIEAGYPESEMFNHYGDLYVYDTPLTERVIDEWLKETRLARRLFVSKFTDQVTGRPMFDVAFQYTPYYQNHPRY